MPLATEHTSPPADPDRRGLPGWTCFSKELLALEAGALFRRHRQIACHVSEVPGPGDYLTFDVAGECALISAGVPMIAFGTASDVGLPAGPRRGSQPRPEPLPSALSPVSQSRQRASMRLGSQVAGGAGEGAKSVCTHCAGC